MGSPPMKMSLCRCVNRIYWTACWAEYQQAREWSRQVGAEHWVSPEHEHHVELNCFFPRECWRRTRGRYHTTVGLSVACTEGAWLARVRVSASVIRGNLADARDGGH